jgi:Obg family GTPase CgtA-like protein
MDLGDEDDRRPTIADVPGLIEGASAGAGLGHAFLRHVERTRVLLHVVDGAARDPAWDHEVIREELRAHDPALLEKPLLVVLNKLDLPGAAEAWPAFRDARARDGIPVIAISAETGQGIDELRSRLAEMLPAAVGLDAPQDPAGVVVHRLEAAGDGYTVEREGDAFRVRGKRIERIAVQTDFENEESAERFQRDLARLGIDEALRRAGIRTGDTVRIGPVSWSGSPSWIRRGERDAGSCPTDAAPVPPARRSCRARSASSAGRSIRSTTAIWRSPRRSASDWGWSASCSSPPGCRRIGRWRPVHPRRIATRWSRSRSPITRVRGQPRRAGPAGPSYSVDTVALLIDVERAAGHEPNLWFIASAEAVRGLPTWRQPERLLGYDAVRRRAARGRGAARRGMADLPAAAAAGRLMVLDGP